MSNTMLRNFCCCRPSVKVQPARVRVRVTHYKTKELFPVKGSEVRELCSLFLQAFSDVLADDEVFPADVSFQQYDEGVGDYVTLGNDEKILIDNLELRASVKNGFIRFHSVKKNTKYRLWSPVSRQNDALIRRQAENAIVMCDGRFEGDHDTVITTSNIAKNLVSLIFHDSEEDKKYAMRGRGKRNDVDTIEFSNETELEPKDRFEPLYFWSYTMFRNEHYKTLYLGCDSNGKVTLVTNSDLDYPNPQALFILNKIVLDGDPA